MSNPTIRKLLPKYDPAKGAVKSAIEFRGVCANLVKKKKFKTFNSAATSLGKQYWRRR